MAGRFATAICAGLLTLAGFSQAMAQGRATAPAALPVATDIRLAGDDSQTRLVMDVTASIGVRAFTLADPYRVVVDIPQTVFQLPPKT
ncbi:AMIN domain-containing protein, partial [Pseudorhodoplanes sp.]|uniref:AMIN domain-containing protein n=1 Tax=Pseudorhodoplanes sp. TaxID=1934341 RepID=UPI0039190BB4